jgi:5-methylcytosine-specific restriction endonuclease McrA
MPRSKRSPKKARSRKRAVSAITRRRTVRASSSIAHDATYSCDACGYTYRACDHGNIAPEDQQSGWICPDCGADADHFQIVVPSDQVDETTGRDEDDIDVSNSLESGNRLAAIKNKNPDVASLLKRWRRGDLDLQPKFQRYDVWTDKIRSLLIESILLELPIPTIYLAENPDGKFVVVDGQQRLTAIFRYHDNKFALVGLKALAAYNGKFFRDLPAYLQTRIEDRALDVTEIYKETDEDVRFTLFERLNRGSVRLNDQELRNCIYRGTYNDFVNELATSPILAVALGMKRGKRHPRMVDGELVLRFLAFFEQGHAKHPDKKTGEFLNRQMELGRAGIYNERDIERQEQAFKDAMQCAQTVYGDNLFKRFHAGSKRDPNGYFEPRLNRALMDVVLNTFARYPKGRIVKAADAIRERTIDLMCTDEFSDLLKHTISSADRIRKRFVAFEDSIKDLLDNDTNTRRAFRASEKKALFDTDPTCRLCGNRIMLLEDAHVDHEKPFSGGGETSLKNAQLAHRFCNLSAGAKRPARRQTGKRSRSVAQ